MNEIDPIDLTKTYYGIEAISCNNLASGIYSKSFRIKTKENVDYFLKIISTNSSLNFDIEKLKDNLNLIDTVIQNSNVSTAKIIKTKSGDLLSNLNDSFFYLTQYLEGESYIRKSDLSKDNLENIGKALANLHNIKTDNLQQIENVNLDFLNSIKDRFVHLLEQKDRLKEDLPYLYIALKRIGDLIDEQVDFILKTVSLVQSSKKVIVHGDPSVENWLLGNDPNIVHLIDWDTCVLANPEMDIVFFKEKEFGDFFRGYSSVSNYSLNQNLLEFYMLRNQFLLLDIAITDVLKNNFVVNQDYYVSMLVRYFYSFEEIKTKAARIV